MKKNQLKNIILFLLLFISQYNYCQSSDEYYQKGKDYVISNDYTNALISYTMAITKNPYDWHYYQGRSALQFITKNFEMSLKDINMALKLKQKYENSECLALRARILIELREYKLAIDDLTYLIDYFPNFMEIKFGVIHLDRAKAYLYSGDKENACKDFNESYHRRMNDAKKYLDDFCK
jgi:tetratricopeptide (TPR) repeat protein